MENLELKFTVDKNFPNSNITNENLRVIFTLPTDDPSKNIIRERIVMTKIGAETPVIFKEPNYKFVPGLHTVQIFYDKSSTTIPLDTKPLVAKRWFYRKLSSPLKE